MYTSETIDLAQMLMGLDKNHNTKDIISNVEEKELRKKIHLTECHLIEEFVKYISELYNTTITIHEKH